MRIYHFFSFGGFIKGIDAINILLYEIIAFLIIFAALYFIFEGCTCGYWSY